MKYCRPRLKFQGSWLTAVLVATIAAPAIAETSNFGTISLSPGTEPLTKAVGGYTGGSYPLSAISNRDQDKKPCIGFADPNPDHILVLEKDVASLKILVNSGGDTTLLIKGPEETTIRCGDDTGKSKDASIDGSSWKRGTYQIWVGTFDSGVKRNYTLTVQQ